MKHQYAVPIYQEGMQDKLLERLISIGYLNGGTSTYDKTAEPLAVLIFPSTRRFMVYRWFGQDFSTCLGWCYERTHRISRERAFRIFKKEVKHEEIDSLTENF